MTTKRFDVAEYLRQSAKVISELGDPSRCQMFEIGQAAHMIISAFKSGNKLMIAGNGGSAAEAQHFAAELVGKFQSKARFPLPAIALTTDTSILTATANDDSVDAMFCRQLQALARAGDVFLAISTSGKSSNIIEALSVAEHQGCKTILLTGDRFPEPHLDISPHIIHVNSRETPLIQQAHLVIIHALCYLIEEAFANDS